MKKNYLRLLSLLPAACLLFTGCSGSTVGTESDAQEANSSSDGTISLVVSGAEEDQDLLNTIANNFIAEYGSEASFDIQIEAISESDAKDTILCDVNNAPDVFTFADDQLSAFASSGLLKPVTYGLDDVSSRNSASSVSAASVNDTLYAYPLTADNGYFLYYDKSVFSDTDVQSMDTLLSVAAAAGKQVSIPITNGWYLFSFYGNTGLILGLNDDGISNFCDWNSTDNTYTGVDVANAILSITSNSAFVDGTDDILKDGAANGTVAAGISGVWIANDMQEAWGDNMGAVKLPTYTLNGNQVQMASYAGYKLVGVNSYSENSEWAEKFAEFMTNEENQTLRFELRAQGPSNTIAASSADVAASPAIQALISQSEFSSLQRVGGNYWTPATDLGTALVSGDTGGLDWQEFLDSIVADITASNS